MKRVIFVLFLIFYTALISVSFGAEGDTFYYEDFSKVKEGHLPKGWAGGEKLLVKSERGKKFLTAFEKGDHSVTITGINYPKNFEVRIVGHLAWYEKFSFRAGSINFGFNYFHNSWLNNSKAKIELLGNKGFSISLRKEGPVITFQVSGNRPIIVRVPNPRFDDTLTIQLDAHNKEEHSKIYEIKMTELSD